MNSAINYKNVFVPGGYPVHTYNPRGDLKLEDKVQSVLENLCKLVIVTGHTKSGKTVLVQKILPREKSIWIDGGGVGSENDFWTLIVDQLDLFSATEIQVSQTSDNNLSAEVQAEISTIVAKGGSKVSTSMTKGEGSLIRRSKETSPKILALKGLRASKTPLVVDDFHYLSKELQGDIVRALKPLVFDGVPVVFIAIPHRRYDAVKVEKEMTGRMFPITIPLWSSDELRYIPMTGFKLLGVDLEPLVAAALAEESIGSPHLMQEFCRGICKIHPTETVSSSLLISKEEIEKVFKETAETIGRPIFEKLARGPQQRSDRIVRKLKAGEEVDIYELVLHALSHIKPGLITLDYEKLRSAIKEVCEPESIPQLQEVARVLKYMSEIAATDQSSTPVIDFDEEGKLLHITDPFFAFYLRWGDIGN